MRPSPQEFKCRGEKSRKGGFVTRHGTVSRTELNEGELGMELDVSCGFKKQHCKIGRAITCNEEVCQALATVAKRVMNVRPRSGERPERSRRRKKRDETAVQSVDPSTVQDFGSSRQANQDGVLAFGAKEGRAETRGAKTGRNPPAMSQETSGSDHGSGRDAGHGESSGARTSQSPVASARSGRHSPDSPTRSGYLSPATSNRSARPGVSLQPNDETLSGGRQRSEKVARDKAQRPRDLQDAEAIASKCRSRFWMV